MSSRVGRAAQACAQEALDEAVTDAVVAVSGVGVRDRIRRGGYDLVAHSS